MDYQQFDVVKLVNGVPEDGIEPGTTAVILDVFDRAEPALRALRGRGHGHGLPLHDGRGAGRHRARVLALWQCTTRTTATPTHDAGLGVHLLCRQAMVGEHPRGCQSSRVSSPAAPARYHAAFDGVVSNLGGGCGASAGCFADDCVSWDRLDLGDCGRCEFGALEPAGDTHGDLRPG